MLFRSRTSARARNRWCRMMGKARDMISSSRASYRICCENATVKWCQSGFWGDIGTDCVRLCVQLRFRGCPVCSFAIVRLAQPARAFGSGCNRRFPPVCSGPHERDRAKKDEDPRSSPFADVFAGGRPSPLVSFTNQPLFPPFEVSTGTRAHGRVDRIDYRRRACGADRRV